MEPIKQYRVILIALNANMANFVAGTFVGWSSPVIPKLRNHTADSPLDVGITTMEEGWITSIISIGAMIAAIASGPLTSKVGRKWTLLLSSIVIAVSYVLLLIGSKVWIMLVARLIQGFGGAFVLSTLPMYIGEITTTDWRGPLGSLMTLFMICGILYAYIIGPFVSYMTLQWCCIAVTVMFLATFVFMPETPYFYAIKGRQVDGLKSLQFLRGQSATAVESEMAEIQRTVDEAMANRTTLLDIVRNRGNRKAILICTGLLAFQQLTGTTAVTFNSQSIFNNAKSSLDPAVATIILGLVQLVANLFTPFIVEKTGRRIILLTSAIGMSIALFALGAFFYVQTFGDASVILWLPVPALIIFNIMYSFGFGPIPWTLLTEMFAPNIKSNAMSIAVFTSWLFGFIVTRWFPELNALGPYYAFWGFGLLCSVAFFFVLLVVIETKGLSLQQIQDKLNM